MLVVVVKRKRDIIFVRGRRGSLPGLRRYGLVVNYANDETTCEDTVSITISANRREGRKLPS
jgi:hypothetical protein